MGATTHRALEHAYKERCFVMEPTYYNGEWIQRYQPLWWHRQGLSQTVSGYGARLTSAYIAVLPDGRKRRIYMTQHSNTGSLWIVIDGRRLYLSEPTQTEYADPGEPE